MSDGFLIAGASGLEVARLALIEEHVGCHVELCWLTDHGEKCWSGVLLAVDNQAAIAVLRSEREGKTVDIITPIDVFNFYIAIYKCPRGEADKP